MNKLIPRRSSLSLFSSLVKFDEKTTTTTFIRNSNKPACIDCNHSKNFPDYDKCKKFGEKYITTGYINNEYNIECRNDESKCGINAKEFEKNTSINKILKNYVFRIFLVGTLIIAAPFACVVGVIAVALFFMGSVRFAFWTFDTIFFRYY